MRRKGGARISQARFFVVANILRAKRGALVGTKLPAGVERQVGAEKTIQVGAGEAIVWLFSINVSFGPFYRKKGTLSSRNKGYFCLIFYNDAFFFGL